MPSGWFKEAIVGMWRYMCVFSVLATWFIFVR